MRNTKEYPVNMDDASLALGWATGTSMIEMDAQFRCGDMTPYALRAVFEFVKAHKDDFENFCIEMEYSNE